MAGTRSRQVAALGLTLLLLASCRHHATEAIEAPLPSQRAPRPVLAAQYGAIVPPPRAVDGSYRTINSGIDAEQTIWHVRAALNVAAIGCRSEADAGLVPAYNTLLKSQKIALAAADASVKKDFHKRLGPGWQNAHDAYMTQLYNFFAQPAAKAAFCAAADEVGLQAAAVSAGGFEMFAQTALPKLEAPFLETYRAVDDYKIALAEWQANQNKAPTNKMAAETASSGPRLRYSGMDTLIAWEAPERSMRLAER